MTSAQAATDAPAPFWKNPFVIGLLVGVAALTVLPFLQRAALRAPPPLAQMPPQWSLRGVEGSAPAGAAELAGKVWIAQLCEAPCALEVSLGKVVERVEDLADLVALVSVVLPGPSSAGTVEGAPRPASGQWRVVTGTPEELERFARPMVEGLLRQPGSEQVADARGLARTARFVLVDQQGAVRGLWPGDELGKGNAINAARMLARHGPNP